jgi:integrase
MKKQVVELDRGRKGTVSVESLEGRLRLRWRYQGRRCVLSLGIPDSRVNRTVAEQRANQIQLDIASGNFDLTLKKYRPQRLGTGISISVPAFFGQFTQHKAKAVSPRTIANYRGFLGHLSEYFEDTPASLVNESEAERFIRWFRAKHKNDRVYRERIALLKACWQWGIEQDLVMVNPWGEASKIIRVSPKQMPKPFTREEIGAIIHAFRTDRYYAHYADFVEFLFATGARTGEAIGLLWRHVSDDCSSVWIGESFTRGKRQSTKTNKARTITLTPKLQSLLQSRKQSSNTHADSLVFPSKEGGPIDDNNFRGRAWKTILKRLDITYRKPYLTRHTLISHALDLGMSPVMVSQLTGHNTKTLFENYAGSVNSRPRLPELSIESLSKGSAENQDE